jgi:CheY-like chemotaxis protein
MTHKLLLADDSVTIQRVIELTFADEDVEVTTVGDGQLAIERLDADHFDIVLADVDMPKRDGYEVAAYVKSRPKLAHIPVVLLTGAFEPIDQVRADAAGSSDVLAKPFEPQMVINRVKQLLGNKKEAASYEAPAADGTQRDFGPPQPPTQQAMAPRPPAHTTPAPQEQAPAGAPSAPVSLDDYFDQLDAAFSNLQPASPVPEHETSHPSAMDWSMPDTSSEDLPLKTPAPRSTLPTVEQARPIAPPAPAPLPTPLPPPVRPVVTAPPPLVRPVPPAAPVHQPEPLVAPPVAPPPVARSWQPEPAAAASARPVPPVPPAPAPRPPSPPPVIANPVAPPSASPNPFASLSAAKAEVAAARAAAPVITEEVIEEVVARVLERLSDRVVRETVTEIVSKTAERAVQEEIERIRNGGE